MSDHITFETELRLFHSATSNSASAYVSLPPEVAERMIATALAGQWLGGRKGNFGSAKVISTIGTTSWSNAVYPDKASGVWSLPVKKAVCQAENLSEGDRVRVELEVL